MNLRPLARHEVVVEHLAAELVTEPHVIAVWYQQRSGEQLVERGPERLALESAGVAEHVGSGRAGGRDDTEHLDGSVVERGGAGHDGIAQRARQPGGPSRACRHQLLDEERVAATPSLHIVDVRPVDESAIDGVDELGGRRPIERPNVDSLTPTAFDLGQHRSQRVATVQLVGSERADQEQRANPSDPGQRREERACRAVRPMQILDDDHQRTSLSKPLEHADDELTQPVARHGLLIDALVTELGHQRREQTSSATQNEIEGFAVHVVHQLADDLAERRQRPDLLAEIHASPDAHAEPSLVRPSP